MVDQASSRRCHFNIVFVFVRSSFSYLFAFFVDLFNLSVGFSFERQYSSGSFFLSYLFCCFRVLFYILLFYTEMLAIFCDQSSSSSTFFRRLLSYVRSPPYYVEPNTGHACSQSANTIREEVDILTIDLYQRLKQSVFAAFTTAYFAVFVPCCFTPVSLSS